MTERINVEGLLMARLTDAVEQMQREVIEKAMVLYSPFLAGYGWDFYSPKLAYESFGAGHVLVSWKPTNEPVVYLPPVEPDFGGIGATPGKVSLSVVPIAGEVGAEQYFALKRQYSLAG